MKFKLDENLGRRCQGLFRAAGHDAQTVLEESFWRGRSSQLRQRQEVLKVRTSQAV